MLRPMKIQGLAYEVSQRVPFVSSEFSSDEAIKTSFYFAWDMTFGQVGEHRDHRTGGILRRRMGQIFANTFQGKMAEFAICQTLAPLGYAAEPDLAVEKLGSWDDFDIQVGSSNISVKSTKKVGNLLLLESRDWMPDGSYKHHDGYGKSEALVLVRIDPSPEDLLKKAKLLFSDSCSQLELKKAVAPLSQYRYQIVGAITNADIRDAVLKGHFIPQGATLNRNTTMDADNYYVQSCDFRPIANVLSEIER